MGMSSLLTVSRDSERMLLWECEQDPRHKTVTVNIFKDCNEVRQPLLTVHTLQTVFQPTFDTCLQHSQS